MPVRQLHKESLIVTPRLYLQMHISVLQCEYRCALTAAILQRFDTNKTGWSKEKGIPVVSNWADSFTKADIDPNLPDERPFVAGASVLWGLVGL